MKPDLCVFLVGDKPLIAYSVSSVLRDEGHRAIPYTDPLSALRDARSFRPDVLISDVEMPNLGGVGLACGYLGFVQTAKYSLCRSTQLQLGASKRLERRGSSFQCLRNLFLHR